MDRRSLGEESVTRVNAGIGTVSLVVIGLAAAQGLSARPEPAQAAGDPVKGQKIFTAQKCTTCHKVGGKGGVLAPDLSAVGTRRDAAWLAKFLPNPTTIDPKNPPKVKMTPLKIKGQDMNDLIAYLLSLKGGK
jgi:cytochrome c2